MFSIVKSADDLNLTILLSDDEWKLHGELLVSSPLGFVYTHHDALLYIIAITSYITALWRYISSSFLLLLFIHMLLTLIFCFHPKFIYYFSFDFIVRSPNIFVLFWVINVKLNLRCCWRRFGIGFSFMSHPLIYVRKAMDLTKTNNNFCFYYKFTYF